MKYRSYFISMEGETEVIDIDPKDWTSKIGWGCEVYETAPLYQMNKGKTDGSLWVVFDMDLINNDGPIPVPITVFDGIEQHVGNSIIVAEDENGESRPLTDEEIERIEKNLTTWNGRIILCCRGGLI